MTELTAAEILQQDLIKSGRDRKARVKANNEYLKNIQEENRRSQENSMVDPVTGLPNKRAFELYLKEQIEVSKRYNIPLSVIMIDLNGFKRVNDTAGHKFGDRVLEKLGHDIRGADFLARYGGDEFIVVLPDTPADQTHFVIERILRDLDNFKATHIGETFYLGGSMGVAEFSGQMSGDDLVNVADGLMYMAKHTGKKIQQQERLLGSVAINKGGQVLIEHFQRNGAEKML